MPSTLVSHCSYRFCNRAFNIISFYLQPTDNISGAAKNADVPFGGHMILNVDRRASKIRLENEEGLSHTDEDPPVILPLVTIVSQLGKLTPEIMNSFYRFHTAIFKSKK